MVIFHIELFNHQRQKVGTSWETQRSHRDLGQHLGGAGSWEGPKTWGVHHMWVSEHVVSPKFMATSNVVFLDNVYTKPIDLGKYMMFIDFQTTRPHNINLGLIGSWLNCWNYPEMETFLWEETWSQLSRCWYSLALLKDSVTQCNSKIMWWSYSPLRSVLCSRVN